MQQVFVSIGSNIDPRNNIEEARIILGNLFDCTFSGLYETRAEGFEGNDFINSVVGFETDLQLIELRDKLKQIEKKMGRTDIQKGMSDRIIDLDIILYGDQVIEDDDFDIPSKDIENYLFVLEPLAEIAGALHHPILNNTYSEMLIDLKAN
tara:strand:- start:392 stop:844 length:453 start_codon:yes stop_codon:yes gene_type:complete